LRLEIDVGQAEALAETFCPFKIVDQAPGVIAADVRAVGDRMG
jgi:hypothetical protein